MGKHRVTEETAPLPNPQPDSASGRKVHVRGGVPPCRHRTLAGWSYIAPLHFLIASSRRRDAGPYLPQSPVGWSAEPRPASAARAPDPGSVAAGPKAGHRKTEARLAVARSGLQAPDRWQWRRLPGRTTR